MLRAIRAGGISAALCLLCLILSSPSPAMGGERVVTARVLDAATREPLVDATVIAGAAAASTDAAGRFELTVLDDSLTITIRRIGYRAVTLDANTMPGEVLLHYSPVGLKSLDVVADRAPDPSVGRGTLLDLRTTSRVTLAKRSAPALAERMETTEGISTSRPGSWGSKAALRGLSGERVAVLVDGSRVNRACSGGMDAGLATINPDNVERVEVLAGPGSTLYGSGNIGGVINVVTRGPRADAPFQAEVRFSGSSAVPGGRAGGTIWGRRDHVADARIEGVTGAWSADARSWLALRGTLAYTRGENRDTRDPLPSIPPFEAAAAARIGGRGSAWLEPEVLAAAAQRGSNLAPGETPTDGWAVVNLRAGVLGADRPDVRSGECRESRLPPASRSRDGPPPGTKRVRESGAAVLGWSNGDASLSLLRILP